MAFYTLGQAAKATGKTKTTISNAIKKGRISATKNDVGHYQIEVSELHRVFEPVKTGQSKDGQKVTAQDPLIDLVNPLENKLVQELLKAKDKEISLKEEIVDQVKSERDKIYGLITNQSEQSNREIEALRAKVEEAEVAKTKALKTARRWKEEADKPWYRKLFG